MAGTALDVDWIAVRTVALQVGVREAARQMNLPEDTVKKRCSREGWLSQPDVPRQLKRQVPNVPKAYEALESALVTMGKQTRIGLAKGLKTGADHISRMSGEEVVEKAGNVAQVAKASKEVFNWQAAAASGLRLDVIARMSEGKSEVAVRVNAPELSAESGAEWDELHD